jgi:hypothetical protein
MGVVAYFMKTKTKQLLIKLQEIADDCDDVSRSAVVQHAESRTWKSVAARLRAIIAEFKK